MYNIELLSSASVHSVVDVDTILQFGLGNAWSIGTATQGAVEGTELPKPSLQYYTPIYYTSE